MNISDPKFNDSFYTEVFTSNPNQGCPLVHVLVGIKWSEGWGVGEYYMFSFIEADGQKWFRCRSAYLKNAGDDSWP